MHNMAAGAATAPAAKLEVEEDGGEAGGVAPPRKREKAEPEGATTHAAAAGASRVGGSGEGDGGAGGAGGGRAHRSGGVRDYYG